MLGLRQIYQIAATVNNCRLPQRILTARCSSQTPAANDPFPFLSRAIEANAYSLITSFIDEQDPYEVKHVPLRLDSSQRFPNLVPSEFPSRMIGCVCEAEADAINWIELTKGPPTKCYCGHWFQLVSYEEFFQRKSS
ncbi:unnamed protein product [Dicrocoelium dendriticum]|nr:unnamed protein product [Dicrocoelium dendriticum]